MPNGGLHHCGNCQHCEKINNFKIKCTLRNINTTPGWTTCRDFGMDVINPSGPVYSIVCVVKDKGGGYIDLPWFNGKEVYTKQQGPNKDTIVVTHDGDNKRLQFDSPHEYLAFWEENTPENEK